MQCMHCGATIPDIDDISDFVGGSLTTKLDSIDYDQFYGISDEHSLSLLRLIKRSAGPRWCDDFGNALEIGCGTGGFSLALLNNISLRHVVLTDVSLKMLRLCRERLGRVEKLPQQSRTFATYSGREECFRPRSFDTCFGTAVVHHIVDVPHFLAQVYSLLKAGGYAFFMEPNFEFHRSLTITMAEIVAQLIHNASVSEQDIQLMLNWVAEVHCNVVNSGDIEILAEREDKHLFVAETFESWARAVGFGEVTIFPCDPDPTGWSAIQVYLGQTGISAHALDAIEKRWQTLSARQFDRLNSRDQSPSYLFWLRKTKSGRQRPTHLNKRARLTSVTQSDGPHFPAKLWLDFHACPHAQGIEIFVSGWCLAGEPVRAVQFTSRESTQKLPIWRPRPDVHARMNVNNEYPPLHALCSGIEGRFRVGRAAVVGATVRLEVDIIAVDGRLLHAGTAAPTIDGRTYEMHNA
jgi:ubiquinone/menaquinone biosynthesis C-methylase UbiE